MNLRIGQGFDTHRLVRGRKLMLGGVEIESEFGLDGHSDADVLAHAVASAVLGACGAGDLGTHFPSRDERWRGASGEDLIVEVLRVMKSKAYAIVNLDTTLIAQRPRLGSHREAIQRSLTKILGLAEGQVNLKITSTDELGAIGRGEGIAAMAVVLLEGSS